MKNLYITVQVTIEDGADPEAAAQEVFGIIGNEPLEHIWSVNSVTHSGRPS